MKQDKANPNQTNKNPYWDFDWNTFVDQCEKSQHINYIETLIYKNLLLFHYKIFYIYFNKFLYFPS